MKSAFRYFLILPLGFAALCPAEADNPAYKSGSATFTATPSTRTQFEDAVRSYDERKYAQALDQLERFHQQADFSKPHLQSLHDRTHYYMGLSYQNLNQLAPAKQQFTWVYQHSKNAKLRYNSQVAYQQLNYYQSHRSYAGQGNVFARESIPSRLSAGDSQIEQGNTPPFDYNAPPFFSYTPMPGAT